MIVRFTDLNSARRCHILSSRMVLGAGKTCNFMSKFLSLISNFRNCFTRDITFVYSIVQDKSSAVLKPPFIAKRRFDVSKSSF